MEDLPNVPDTQTTSDSTKLWKNLLLIFIGTTLSIILTFGTNAVIQQHRKAQDRKMTAMMVMGNIEAYAQRLDKVAEELMPIDTLASYLLALQPDMYDNSELHLAEYIPLTGAVPTLSRDKSAEKIFSNSIETWKNMGNFQFIENVGRCFSTMDDIEGMYADFRGKWDDIYKRIINHSDDYPGKTIAAKFLLDEEYQNYLFHIHREVDYLRYLADFLRYENSKNMKLMEISEEAVVQFVKNNEVEVESDRESPDQMEFFTPDISVDSLPDFQTWVKTIKL